MLDLLIFLVILLMIIAPLGIIVHEMGHLIASLLVRADKINVVIGSGRKVLDLSCHPVFIHIHLLFMVGAFVSSERSIAYTRKEFILISLGGPAANLCVAFLLHSIVPLTDPFVQTFLYFNIWLFVTNILPFQWMGRKSDGYHIFKLLLNRNYL